MVRFDKKWFNPLYFILNDLLKDNSIRTVLIYGGKSSAKTLSVSQLLIKEALVKQVSSIAFRKESTTIQTTLKQSLKLAIKTMWVQPAIENLNFSFRAQNSEIIMKGLDDEEKAKGVESYKYLYVDELNHFTEGEFQQFQMSLRGIEGQKIFASWNPVDEESWVKTDLVDRYEFVDISKHKLPCEHSFVKISKCGKVVLIKTTYEDNYWINGSPCGTYGYRDENLINEYKSLEKFDYPKYLVNVLGEWGCVRDVVNPFAHHYDSIKHTMPKVALYPNKQLTLSIDFNLNPFSIIAAFLWTDKDGDHCHIVDEFEIYKGSIPAMIDEIKLRYGSYLHNLQITGDAMGKRGDMAQRDNANYYIQLMRGLNLRESQIKVPSNPTHSNSREEVNYILLHFPDFKIGDNCKQTHFDLKKVQCDAFGSIIKKNRNDLTQRADFMDAVRYLKHTFLSPWKERHQKIRR